MCSVQAPHTLAAGMFSLIFRSFEAKIADAISSFQENRQLPQYILSISLAYYLV